MEEEVTKERLIEQLGVHFEREDQLAPVAARILATLLLAGGRGITFDQLVNMLEASKSTVCTSLNVLTSAEMVGYYTLPGDRKRYFSLAPTYFEQRIERWIARWQYEMALYQQLQKVRDPADESADSPAHCSVVFPDKALQFLEAAIPRLEQLKQTLLQSMQTEKH